MVEEKTQDPARRLELLLKYTIKGGASELIKECPHITPPTLAYDTATKLLAEDYGRTVNIENAYYNKAESWETIKSGDAKAMRAFAIFLDNCCHVRSQESSL